MVILKHPRKWFLVALIIAVFFTSIPVWAGEEGVVKGSKVNLRKGPGTNYSVITKTEVGQGLTILNRSADWLQVRLYNGNEGWIHKDLVEVKNILTTVTVTGNLVNLRKGPGTNYGKAGQVNAGLILPVYQEKDGWYMVQAPGSGQAWIAGWLVNARNNPGSSTTPVVTTNNYLKVMTEVLNIRSGPGTNYQVVSKIGLYETHQILEQKDEWYKIRIGNIEGWVTGQYVELVSQPLPNSGTSASSSRGSNVESEVLIAPIADGKTFKILDSAGRPVLLLEGWTSSQYQIRSTSNNTIVLEMDGPTQRNYEGKNTRLGIQGIKIYPQGAKAIIELTFSFPLTQDVNRDDANKITRIQIATMQAQGLSGKVIVVDPGHSSVQSGGWLDPGAIGKTTGLKEKDVNLDIAFKLKQLLEQAGARVVMTHSGQTQLSLAQRAWLASNVQADIFVSIHANFSIKGNISGHTTYYYAPVGNALLASQRYSRQKLASLVQRELVKAGGRKDMGVLEQNFAVLRETSVPSILVETAFLSDPQEERLLGNDAFRQKVAAGVFNGIKAYFE